MIGRGSITDIYSSLMVSLHNSYKQDLNLRGCDMNVSIKSKAVINGWLNIYAQYGWKVLRHDNTLIPFDPVTATYTDRLGRYDSIGILSTATFKRRGIEMIHMDEYGRTTAPSYRDYDVINIQGHK